MATMIYAPLPVGDVLDRITILEIKLRRITDGAKLDNVRRELTLLRTVLVQSYPDLDALADPLVGALQEVNERLWDVEDRIRDCERRRAFDADFVALARSVYVANDQRAALKRDLNRALGSALFEEKSYAGH